MIEEVIVPMKKPPHPGRIVRMECLEPLGLTIRAAATVLGVTRQVLNNVVNGRAGISPEMAVRLSKAFGGSAGMWLRLQANYDARLENGDRCANETLMDEKGFKKHLRDLVHGHHHPEEHDWANSTVRKAAKSEPSASKPARHSPKKRK